MINNNLVGVSEAFGQEVEEISYVINTFRKIFHQYGFDELQTPILQTAKKFSGHHGEGEDILFNIKDLKGESLVLKYDQTVPAANFAANRSDGILKRFEIGKSFRDDDVGKGHFREFTQCDADIFGDKSLSADVETIQIAYDGLKKLGLTNFKLNINHRKIIQEIAEKANIKQIDMQRNMDYISKFIEKNEEVDKQKLLKENLDELLDKSFSSSSKEIIKSIFLIDGEIKYKLKKLGEILNTESARMAIQELDEIISMLDNDIVSTLNFDFCLARGADYYTGFIFEGSLPCIGIGAILGGGRYDNLVENLGGKPMPAIGFAFGLERIMIALTELNLFSNLESTKDLLISPIKKSHVSKLFLLASEFRKDGRNVNFLPMIGKTREEVNKYANSKGFKEIITE